MALNPWLVGAAAILPSLVLLAAKTASEGGLVAVLVAFLSLGFLVLQFITSFTTKHVALGAQVARDSVALTDTGVGFLQQLYRSVIIEEGTEDVSVGPLAELMGSESATDPQRRLERSIFWGGTLLRYYVKTIRDGPPCLES